MAIPKQLGGAARQHYPLGSSRNEDNGTDNDSGRNEECVNPIFELPLLPSTLSLESGDGSAALMTWLAETLAVEQEAISQEVRRCHAAILAHLQEQTPGRRPPSSLGSSGGGGQHSPLASATSSPRVKARPRLPQLSPGRSTSHQSTDWQSSTSDSASPDHHRKQADKFSYQPASRSTSENVLSPKQDLDLGAQVLGKAETAEDVAVQKKRSSGIEEDNNQNSNATLIPSVQPSEGSGNFIKSPLSSAVEIVRTSLRRTSGADNSNNGSTSSRKSVNKFMASINAGSRQTRDKSHGLEFTPVDEGEKVEVKATLYDFVSSAKFEMVMAVLIMLNAVFLAAQMQYHGLDLGHSLEYRWYHRPATQSWPGAVDTFKYLDYAFGAIFTLEMLLKAAGLRSAWLKDCWNVFDLGIMLIWYAELLTMGSAQDDMPIKASFVRTARLARLQRLFKLAKTIQGFDDLYLMTTTLKASVSVLAWSCLLLLLVQMLIALAVNELLTAFYFRDPYYPLAERQEVFAYFGTFSRSMLTMFEMTLANWPPVCRLLQEYVNEWFVVFCVLHKLTIGFAVIGVINGVFMQETFSVAATDDRIMLNQRERQMRSETKKLLRLMRAADISGDGFVDREEFKRIISFEEVRLWLGSMGLDVTDADAVFTLVDADGDGQLSAQELVSGIGKLKGTARSIDLNIMMRRQKAISKTLGCDFNIPKTSLGTGFSGGSRCSRESRHSMLSRLSVAFEGKQDEDVEELWREANGACPVADSFTPRLHAQAFVPM